jgi:hypothetical protein
VGDGADGQRLPGSGAGDDPEAGARPLWGDGDPLGERGQFRAARGPEEGLNVEPEAELDRFTGRTGGGDDDEAPTRIPRPDEGLVVGGEIRVADRAERIARRGTGGSYGPSSRGFRSRGAAGWVVSVGPGLGDGDTFGGTPGRATGARLSLPRCSRDFCSNRSPASSRSDGP